MIEVHRLSGALGARVSGVDLAHDLNGDMLTRIQAVFDEHLVLVFPGQDLDPAAQVAFTEHFGLAEPHPLRTRRSVEGFPQVLVLENRPGRRGARNDYWHSDISHAEKPPAATFLYALQVPEGRGDTMFCNMYAAYDALSPGMRILLDGMQAVHSGQATRDRSLAEPSDALEIPDVPPPRMHPVVRTHPRTGRRALFVNPHFTTGFADMTEQESRPMLDYLISSATRPENVYRHRWSARDLVMWDNRCAMHYAVRDYDEHMTRIMHRTTAAGDRPH